MNDLAAETLSGCVKGADGTALVLASAVEEVNDRPVLRGRKSVQQPGVDSGIGDAHLALIGLGIIQARRRSFLLQKLRRIQPGKKFVDFRYGQVGDGVKVMGAVATW